MLFFLQAAAGLVLAEGWLLAQAAAAAGHLRLSAAMLLELRAGQVLGLGLGEALRRLERFFMAGMEAAAAVVQRLAQQERAAEAHSRALLVGQLLAEALLLPTL